MAPKNNPTPEEMNHDALIGVTDLGNPTTGRRPELDTSITNQDIPDPQPTPEKLAINEKASMENLLEVIKLLGESNRQTGFQAMAADTALSADRIARGKYRDRSDFKGAVSFLEDADKRRRAQAFQKYTRALQYATGKEIPDDDIALLVGWKLFSSEYGAKGEAAQAHRKEARDLLEKALPTFVVIAPVETYYEPNKYRTSTEADSEQTLEWPLLEDDELLTTSDKALVPDMGAMRAAFLAVRESKGGQILRDRHLGDDDPKAGLSLDELAEANAKAVDVVTTSIDQRADELATTIRGIDVSWTAIYQFLVAANPETKESFRITPDRVNVIMQSVIPDVAELIAAKMPDGASSTKEAVYSTVARHLFSTDLDVSYETANRILGMLTDRKKVLQADVAHYDEFKQIVQHWADSTVAEAEKKTT